MFRLGTTGPVLLPRRRPLVLGARLHRAVDVRHADAAGRLQEDPARARALARARVGARHRPGRRSGAARADSADRARQQERAARRPTSRIRAMPQFQPIETDDRAARGEHRQGHLQGRRSLLHVLPGRLVRRQGARSGPWEVAQSVPQEIYKIPASSPAHHVTYVTVEDDDDDDVGRVRGRGRLHRHDGRVGLHGVGLRLVLSAVLRATAAAIPYYYPHYPDLRLLRLVQPVDRRVRPRRRRLRSVWRRRRRRALQPAHRHLRARRGGLRSVRRARRRRRRTTRAPAPTRTTRQGSNVYGSWGSTSVQRGDDWAKTNRYTNNRTGNTTRTVRTDEGAGVVRRGDNGGASPAGSAATSTRATTATSIARTAAAPGRGTTTAAGRTPTANQPSGARPSPTDRPATDRDGRAALGHPAIDGTAPPIAPPRWIS